MFWRNGVDSRNSNMRPSRKSPSGRPVTEPLNEIGPIERTFDSVFQLDSENATRTLLIIVLLITHVSPMASECDALSRPPAPVPAADRMLPPELVNAGSQN